MSLLGSRPSLLRTAPILLAAAGMGFCGFSCMYTAAIRNRTGDTLALRMTGVDVARLLHDESGALTVRRWLVRLDTAARVAELALPPDSAVVFGIGANVPYGRPQEIQPWRDQRYAVFSSVTISGPRYAARTLTDSTIVGLPVEHPERLVDEFVVRRE